MRAALNARCPVTGWVAALLVFSLPACAHLTPQERLAPVRVAIAERLRAGAATSLAVAVARGSRILWEEGFGWADRESEIAAGPHTPYSVASISKTITAMGLMVLVERGLLRLDRPVNDYLGDAVVRVRVGEEDDVTLRRLANHTSGLPRHHHFFPSDEPYRRPPMEVTIRRYANVVVPPGEEFGYSNLGYGILEHVIERVSGRPFAAFMDEEVLHPLGLEHTAVVVDPSRHSGLAARYRRDGSRLPFYDSDHRGASAFYACAHDLVRLGMFHLEEDVQGQVPILSGRGRRRMRRPISHRSDEGYGVGWRTTEHPSGLRLVEHGGSMPGVSAVLTLVPEQRVVVAVVASAWDDTAERVRDEILAVLAPVRLSTGRVAAARTMSVGRKQSRSRLPGWALGRWIGCIDTPAGVVPFRMTIGNEAIQARLGTHPETTMKGVDFRGPWLRGILAEEIRTPDTNRRPHRLYLRVRRRGDRLQGAITAISLPGPYLPLALSFWIDLGNDPSPGWTRGGRARVRGLLDPDESPRRPKTPTIAYHAPRRDQR